MRVLLLAGALSLISFPVIAQDVETNPAGRPGKILNDADCQSAWKMAGGKELNEKAAQPYVTNFDAVDKNNDSQITKAEFEAGCNVGWIEADGAKQSEN